MKNSALILLVLVSLFGCKTKSLELVKTSVEKKIKKDSSVLVNLNAVWQQMQIENTSDWTETIAALDSSKPMVINGVLYSNVILKKQLVLKTKHTDQKNTVLKKSFTKVSLQEKNKVVKKDNKTKSEPIFWASEWVISFFVIIIFIALWFYFRVKSV